MACTVAAWFHGLPEDSVRLCTANIPLRQPFSGIHIAERPEQLNASSQNQLILTTGVAMLNENELEEFLLQAMEYRCSGLILQSGLFLSFISDAVIQLCEARKFPLFFASSSITPEKLMSLSFDILRNSTTVDCDTLSMALNSSAENAAPLLAGLGLHEELYYQICIYSSPPRTLSAAGVHDGYAVLFVKNELTSDELRDAVESGDYVIGRPFRGSSGIFRSYREAASLLTMKRQLSIASGSHEAGAIAMKVLLNGRENEKIRSYLRAEYYEPLLSSDTRCNTGYLPFIRVYLRLSGHTGAIASELKIHRNTVLYKIHKIEQLLGCRLQDTDTRMCLHLSFYTAPEEFENEFI